jgi:hypothetical protein
MATKAQQNDDGTVSDPITRENQRGYANYEKEQQKAQQKRELKFEDSTPLSEKIANKIGDVLYPISKEISKIAAPGAQNAEKKRQESKKLQNQYEAQDKQEGRKMKSGGMVSSASKRADGCAIKGKTKGRMV